MNINRKYFTSPIPDNEEQYLGLFCGFVESLDELSSLQITKLPEGYHFRLAPSTPQYTNMLIEEIINFNNLFKIRLDLSKSMKTNSTISFKILNS